jgi:hypothetical protein
MNANLRADLAFIAAKLLGQNARSTVFDHASGMHIPISGDVNPRNVQIFDHARGAHITGCVPNLFDHLLGAHVTINFAGAEFSGFEHLTGSHFTGRVSGSSVTVFDSTAGGHFHYSVS